VKLQHKRFTLAAVTTLVVAFTVAGASAGNAYVPSIPDWVGTWSASPTAAGAGSSAVGFTNESVRMIVRTSVGGEAVRVRLSATYGDRNLNVGHATVALPEASTPELTDVKASTIRDLSFNGGPSVVVPKGGQVLSDPLTFAVAPLQDLVVTLFFPVATGPSTWHFTARAESFVAAGDQAAAATGTAFTTARTSWYFLSAVEVLNRRLPRSIVVLGDSITDGTASTLNGNKRWTDRLAERLVNERPIALRDFGVLNQGLVGNRLTHDGSDSGFPELGVNALARLHRDVFSQSGVRTVIVLLGINDIQAFDDPAPTVIDALRQIVLQAQQVDIEILLGTITPFEGFRTWTPQKEATRQAVNAYIRTARDLDGVLDFDALLRDPAQPTKLRAEWDSGDHLHPNDAGYRAMADSVPLAKLLF
jgi:lysophospholipase L1-like esterase